MKLNLNTLLMLALCLMVSFSLSAQSSYTELMDAGFKPQSELPALKSKQDKPQTPQGVEKDVYVDFITHRPTFDFEICVDGDLTVEDFDPASNPPICSRPSGLNSTTAGIDGSCFPPGSIAPGFTASIEIPSIFSDDIIVITPSLGLGNTENVIGPNFFVDDLILDFAPGISAVSFDYFLGSGLNPNFTIDVYDAGLSLIETGNLAVGDDQKLFVGIVADQEIGRIVITAFDGGGELISNLSFGTCGDSGDDLNVISYGCEGDASYDDVNEVTTVTALNCIPTPPFTSDKLIFTYEELCGDGEIIAHVDNVSGFGFAGIMMAEELTDDSKKVALGRDNGYLARREVRTMTGGPAYPQQFPLHLAKIGCAW